MILLCTHNCFAQSDTIKKHKTIYGVSSGVIAGWGIRNANYTHFTMQKGQSFFSIGPVVGNKKNLQYPKHDFYFHDNSLALTGVNAVYQLYPHPEKKVFQSYFMNELFFRYYSDKGRTQFIYTNNGYDVYLPAAINYNFHQSIIGAYLGWGFRANFLKNFYLSSNAVVGLSYLTTVQNYENDSYNDKFDYFDYNLFLKAGLGYKFDSSNKKLKKHRNEEFTDSMFLADFNIVPDSQKYKAKEKPKIKEKQKTDEVTSKAILGISTGIQPLFELGTTTHYTNFTFQKGKNAFELGLMMGEKEFLVHGTTKTNQNNYGVKGVNLIYQRIPKPYNQRFQFYFQNLLCFSYSYFDGSGYLGYPYYFDSSKKSYHADQTIISNHFSYGCKIKLLKNFYIDQSFGFGIVTEWLKVNYENYYIDKNTASYMGVLMKLGVGYTFNRKP